MRSSDNATDEIPSANEGEIMEWSSIQDYRDSCKRINTRINPVVERVIADRISEQSAANRCAWCEVGECVSTNNSWAK